MLDVVTIGSATLDIFLRSRDFKINHHQQGVYLCEQYQGKIEAQELVFASGGGATNAAVSYARKGLKTAPIIEMGRDPAAKMILLELAREKVDLSLVIQEPDETTAASVILLAGSGGNSIVTYRGASRMLTPSDIHFNRLGMRLKPGGWIHLTNLGGDMELIKRLLDWARAKNRKVFWNPGKAEIKKITVYGLRFTDYQITVLQLNQVEYQQLKNVKIPSNTTLIITNGRQGGEVRHQGQVYPYRAARAKTVDCTGAGDAFGSGFVAALIEGRSIAQAIEIARVQAANVVKFTGAKEGLLPGSRMDSRKVAKK